MRVLIVTVGTRFCRFLFFLGFFFVRSRGDVQPFTALASLLLKRNSSVAIATHEEFRGLVEGVAGCVYFSLNGSPTGVMREFIESLAEGSITTDVAFAVRVAEEQEGNREKMWEAAVSFKPTLILSMMSNPLECASIATRLGVPSVVCTTYPLYPSKERTPMSMMSNQREFPLAMAHLMSSLGFKIAWSMSKGPLNKWRASLGLEPLTEISWDASPVINLYSPMLAPRPSDWPAYVYDCGVCFFEDVEKCVFEPSPDLEAFLAAGSPPIYFGFGSMPVSDDFELVKMYARVCSQLGRRGVVLCSKIESMDTSTVSDIVFLVDSVPHWWLFPRCCAVVCHGGAGTTASALKAGVPCE
jgi:sterol 3beta-glucosyltransferase